MSRPTTLTDLLALGAAQDIALTAPRRTPLTYADLRTQVQRTVERLNQLRLGRGDRIAISLPNGPDMASAFLSVAAGATACPLNPAYRAEEFEFYLCDLKASALLVEAGDASSAVEVARQLGVRVLTLEGFDWLEVVAFWNGDAPPLVRALLDEGDRYIREVWPEWAASAPQETGVTPPR